MPYRRQFVVNGAKISVPAGTTLSDFPVMVMGTFPWLATVANGGFVTSSHGYDIWFSDNFLPSPSLHLPYERVAYDPLTGACEFHIRFPLLTAGMDQGIYMFYGDPSVVSDITNKTAVWDANYAAVWHFGDSVTIDVSDSTANGNNGTTGVGTLNPSPAAGLIGQGTALSAFSGGAASFDGTQFVDLPSISGSLDITGAVTVEDYQYVNGPATSSNQVLFAHGDDTDGYEMRDGSTLGSGGAFDCPYLFAYKSGVRQGVPQTTAFADGVDTIAWDGSVWDGIGGVLGSARSLVASYGPAVTLIRQGGLTPAGLANWSAPAMGSNVGNRIGSRLDGTFKFNGFLDELRISNILRSDDWLWTSYLTTNFPGAEGPDFSSPRDPWFYRIGPATFVPPNPNVIGNCFY